MKTFRRKGKNGKFLSPFYYFRFSYGGKEHVGSTHTTDAALAKEIMHQEHEPPRFLRRPN